MSYYELFLLAIGLCLDTFAVSVSGGICLGPHCRRRRRIIILTMSLFQSSMAILGWLAGSGFQHLIENCDHWIAFGLLLFIGGKMLVESFTKTEGEKINLLNNKTLITVSFATSIDALAVGVSLALLHLPLLKISIGGLIIAIVTAVAAFLGLIGGRHIGKRLSKGTEIAGGLILIALGVKILLEHTGIL